VIAIVSDTHFYDDSNTYNLNNQKLESFEQLLNDITTQSDQVSDIVHCGDLFHTPFVSYKVAGDVFDILAGVKHRLPGKIYILVGNHEIDQDYHTPLTNFCKSRNWIEEVGRDIVYCGNIAMQGFVFDKSDMALDCLADCYISHACVEYSDVDMWKGIPVNYLENTGFQRVLMGDIHKPVDGRVTSVGTLFPSSFKDLNYPSTYLLFDEIFGSVQRKYLHNWPRFIKITRQVDLEFNPVDVANNFVKLVYNASVEKVAELYQKDRQLCLDMGARNVYKQIIRNSEYVSKPIRNTDITSRIEQKNWSKPHKTTAIKYINKV